MSKKATHPASSKSGISPGRERTPQRRWEANVPASVNSETGETRGPTAGQKKIPVSGGPKKFPKIAEESAVSANPGPPLPTADQLQPSPGNADSDTAAILPGIKPALELLETAPEKIDTLFLLKGRRSADSERILDLCRMAGVRFRLVDSQGISRICPSGGHQGVVVRLFDAGFMEFTDLLNAVPDAPLPLLVVLDQVQDTGNVGTLARTLYALGGAGLVIPRHNGAWLGPGARRAAAGALERLPVAKVANISRALDEAHAAGYPIYGTAMAHDCQNAFTANLPTPALLVLGSEEHGIREQVAKRCDHMLQIPMLRDFDSLNVAQAGAILISCFARQNRRN